MRNAIWRWTRRNIPDGALLPWWALAVRCAMFPLSSVYWRLDRTQGYQLETDTWIINGVRYSARSLAALAEARGDVFRVTRTGETVTLERLGVWPVVKRTQTLDNPSNG